jgi:type IV pilus assembly protein PilN
MIRINLLPVRETKKKARLRVQGLFLVAAVGVGVVLSAVWHGVMTARVSAKRSAVQSAQAEIKKLEETRKEVDRYKDAEEEFRQKLAVIDSLETTRFANVRVMDEIATRIPERMWLREMSLNDRNLRLNGIGIDAEIVAQFLSSLETAPDFADVALEETTITEAHGLKLNSFRIRARYGKEAPKITPKTPEGKKKKGKKAKKGDE